MASVAYGLLPNDLYLEVVSKFYAVFTSKSQLLCLELSEAFQLKFLTMIRKHSIYPAEFPEPWASDWGEDEYGLWMGFTYKGVRQIFRWIEPWTFMMGSPESEPGHWEDEVQHLVRISQGFWLA